MFGEDLILLQKELERIGEDLTLLQKELERIGDLHFQSTKSNKRCIGLSQLPMMQVTCSPSKNRHRYRESLRINTSTAKKS